MANDLYTELKEVEQLISSVPAELVAPLNDLAASEIEQLNPYLRAWFVLSAGVHDDEAPDVQRKRIYLAAALETLFLALNIHKHLLNADVGSDLAPNNRSLVGSMILAADWLKQKSAAFAAKTDDPSVVTIFSEALMMVSEGHLRQIHNDTEPAYDEVQDLISAGTRAAVELCQLPDRFREPTLQISQRLMLAYNNSPNAGKGIDNAHAAPTSSPSILNTLDLLPVSQQARWRALAKSFIDVSAS